MNTEVGTEGNVLVATRKVNGTRMLTQLADFVASWPKSETKAWVS